MKQKDKTCKKRNIIVNGSWFQYYWILKLFFNRATQTKLANC